MAVNKAYFGTTTLIDLTDSNVTPQDLRDGVIAYGKSGQKITGKLDAAVTGGGTFTMISGDNYKTMCPGPTHE